jgi:cytochrome c556
MKPRTLLTTSLTSIAVIALAGSSVAQAPARGSAAKGATRTPSFEVDATLAQLMKGTLYPASNVVFAAQGENPADVPPEKDPSAALNPLASAYGKWQAVENAGLAMTEVANLLLLPSRKCSNGKPVPIDNPDWTKFVQGLRGAGLAAYKAAQSKNQDNILMAADTLTTACANCHDKYREKTNLADRCQ